MKWLSQSVEELITGEQRTEAGVAKVHDAVIVGSGYGGAVSALRLAEMGVKVLVLERGEEWVSGEFPSNVGNAFGEMRVDRSTASNVTGNESGLYDWRIGYGIGALIGNGLGGTSLINASVAMRPDVRVFHKTISAADVGSSLSAWPSQLRTQDGTWPEDLERAYALATDTLGAAEFTTVWVSGPPDKNGVLPNIAVEPEKRKRLRELSDEIESQAQAPSQVNFVPVSLTVATPGTSPDNGHPPLLTTCIGCGECVSGCNQNAKKSLNMTYLPKAYEAGARMFTGATVLSLARTTEGEWAVNFVRTASRAKQREGCAIETFQLLAKHVILSAGTFGSTEILQRSKTTGLPLSPQLGKRLSTNGDSLAFGYMLDKPVNGVGNSSEAVKGATGVGPTITGAIRIDHPTDVEKSVLIEEGAIPGALSSIFHELISVSSTFAQLDECNFKGQKKVDRLAGQQSDWAVLQPRGLTHTQTLLAMGHDQSLGEIEYLDEKDRVAARYNVTTTEEVFLLQQQYLANITKQGAIYIQNPILSPLPENLRKVLDTPIPGNASFTVHPLGGCCMGEDLDTGVTDHLGRVFNPDADSIACNWYQGLYVLDGSIVPTSLGANPLLTITALSERAMAVLAPEIAKDVGGGKAKSETLPERPTPDNAIRTAYLPYNSEVKLNFTEAMRGEVQFEGKQLQAYLLLHLPIDDLVAFSSDPVHQIVIPNQTGRQSGDREQLEPLLRLDLEDESGIVLSTRRLKLVSGVVSILPVTDESLSPISRRVRTMLTWLLDRGIEEIYRAALDWFKGKSQGNRGRSSAAGFWTRVVGFFKLAKHSSECRTMQYRLNLIEEYSNGAEPKRTYTLVGNKQVGYPARWQALLRKALMIDAHLDRPNVWAAFGEMRIQVLNSSNSVAGSGTLNLDMREMTRYHAPQIGIQRDTPNALVALAGYPLWFARLIAKTRLWDFRAPDYPDKLPIEFDPNEGEVPDSESDPKTPWPTFKALRVFPNDDAQGFIEIPPEPTISFAVKKSVQSDDTVELRLTRYKQKALTCVAAKNGVRKVKALLMLNGFAQSTLGFIPQEHERSGPPRPGGVPHALDEPGLAEFFYEQGFDIWLFDYRTSSILEASKLPCSMDDIAQFDIPRAAEEMLTVLRKELGLPADAHLQVQAFAHCVGAASMAMSLLGGYLQYEGQDFGRLSAVTFSQMQAFLVGGKTAQLRLQVGGLLRDTLGIEYLRLSAAERKPTPFEALLDRLFASLPVDAGERCPHENARYVSRPDICTCKRMSGTISRLLKHDRIKDLTHERLPIYFGRANTGLLVHGGRCVENERLVNADGQNVYVTDENIARYLGLPVAIMHGAHNVLFDVESAYRTFDQLCRIHPTLRDAKVYQRIVADDFAHFDCTIGYGPKMHEQILTPLKDFYSRAWEYNETVSTEPDILPSDEIRSEAKAPLCGPIVGWTRTQERDGRQFRVFRLWIEVDETESDKATWAVTRVRIGHEFSKAQLWPVIRVPLEPGKGSDPKDLESVPSKFEGARVTIALADVVLEASVNPADVWIEMFSAHEFRYRPIVSGQAQPQGPTTSRPSAPVGTVQAATFPRPVTEEEVKLATQQALDLGRIPGIGVLPRSVIIGLPGPSGLFLNSLLSVYDKNIGNTGGGPIQFTPNGNIVPDGDISLKDAATLLRGIALKDEMRHDTALRGNQQTLSRKTTQLPPSAGFPYTAHLNAAQLAIAADWFGLRFVAGCCRYPGLAFEDVRSDASFERIAGILESDQQGHRDFMFMLGDQIYADASAGLLDSPSPIEKIVLRNRRAFGTSGFNRVTSQLPTYMVVDDHEIGDNWSLDDLNSCDQSIADKAAKLLAAGRSSFAAYQWAHSPRNVAAPGFNYSFEEKGFSFFVLDTRTERERFNGTPKICKQEQLDSLEVWLADLKNDGRPKFIVSGSVFAPGLGEWRLPDGKSNPMAESWQLAAEQRRRVLEMIERGRIRNVVFLSGDYHCSATATIRIGSALMAYAIVTPPLYAPLPGANANAEGVLPNETIRLANCTATIDAKARDGNGFADIHIDAIPGDRWRLSIHLNLIDFNDKIPRFAVCTEHLLLG